jgi:hypothetical protein
LSLRIGKIRPMLAVGSVPGRRSPAEYLTDLVGFDVYGNVP